MSALGSLSPTRVAVRAELQGPEQEIPGIKVGLAMRGIYNPAEIVTFAFNDNETIGVYRAGWSMIGNNYGSG